MTPLAQKHFTRNWLALFGDFLFFSLGLTLASTSTTLPAFAATLTDNKVLIGAVASVWSGAWLLPQIFAANYLSDKPRKYPYMIWGQAIGRSVFPLFVLWLMLGGVRWPGLTLALFLAMLAFFSGTDAFVALAWFDLYGKALTPPQRARLSGIAQAIIGVVAIGAGALIQWALGPSGLPYPANYILILGLAALSYELSFAACAFIVEIPEPVTATRTSLRDYLPELIHLWRTDAAFSRVTLVRLIGGLGGLATAFYVVYATDILKLPLSTVGWFASAYTLGTATAGLTLGFVAERYGSQRVIKITAWFQFAIPVLALVCASGVLGAAVPLVYPALYFMLGLFEGSVMLGFMNYVLDIAPPSQRPTYMGLTNTLTGLLVVVPMLGGWIVQLTASYPTVFALAAVGTLAGAVLALGLPVPPHHTAAPPAAETEKALTPAP